MSCLNENSSANGSNVNSIIGQGSPKEHHGEETPSDTVKLISSDKKDLIMNSIKTIMFFDVLEKFLTDNVQDFYISELRDIAIHEIEVILYADVSFKINRYHRWF